MDLKSMSRKELEKLQRDVAKALEQVQKQELKMAREAAAKAAAQHGFSLDEIIGGAGTGRKMKSASATKSAPKYRSPDDPGKTWTGKGRQPDWFRAAIQNGADPKSLEI